METLIANLAGTIRREKMGGRDFLVAPLTLIVSGVLNGSRGPGFYPPEEIQNSVDAWNVMPILWGHPAKGSGRDPKIINSYGLGHVFNATYSDGKLVAEGWFDIEKALRVDNRLISFIEQGKKIELSTGLGVERDDTTGVHNGKDYHWIARGHRPDHLAILFDGVGACSLADGCGVNNSSLLEEMFTRNGMPKPIVKPDSEDNTMKLTPEQRKAIVDDLITNCSCTFKDEDRKTLDAMEDASLTRIQTLANNRKETVDKATELETKVQSLDAIVSNARKGIDLGEIVLTLNEKGNWISKDKKPATPPPSDKKEITLDDLPAEVRNKLNRLDEMEKKEKRDLVVKLVSNISDEKERMAKGDALMKLETSVLDTILSIMPTSNGQPATPQQRDSYLGANVANSSQQQQQPKAPTPLGLPVWNFEKQSAN